MGKKAAAAAETSRMNKRRTEKGRPCKWALKKSSNHHHHFKNSKNPKSRPSPNRIPLRRSTRRNRNPGVPSPPDDEGPSEEEELDDGDEDDERSKKKVKLVGRLSCADDPIPKSLAKFSVSSPFNAPPRTCNANGGGGGSGIGADPETFPTKKRTRINGDDGADGGKDPWKATCNDGDGTELAMLPGPTTTTPLPDKKLLLSILGKLEKKDTRGAFAEPVDTEELPDYHEVIENPMDFSTIRKKLDGGIYFTLEQLEADVFLVCSNAMEYNASHTIYFRQARLIKELAKVEFGNLRHCSSDVKQQPEPNIDQQPKSNVEQPLKPRRGRPPGSGTKRRSLQGSPADHASPSFSSPPPTLSVGLRSSHYNLRKGPSLLKFHSADGSSRISNYAGVQVNNRITLPGREDSAQRASHIKFSRMQFEPEDSRRATYIHPGDLLSMTDNRSGLASFGRESQPLLLVGFHSDHGFYARSLARFAANLGPLVWRIAAKKIKSVLPGGVEFGPGWVGETDATPVPRSASENPLPLVHSQCIPHTVKSPYPSTTILSSATLSDKPFMPSEGVLVDGRGIYAQGEFTLLNGVVRGSDLQTPYWAHESSGCQVGIFDGLGAGYVLANSPDQEMRPVPSSSNTSSFAQGSLACQLAIMNSGGTVSPSLEPGSHQLTPGSCRSVNPDRERPLPMDYWAGMDVGAVKAAAGYHLQPFWPEEKWVSSSIARDMNIARLQTSSNAQVLLEIGSSSPQVDLMLQL